METPADAAAMPQPKGPDAAISRYAERVVNSMVMRMRVKMLIIFSASGGNPS